MIKYNSQEYYFYKLDISCLKGCCRSFFYIKLPWRSSVYFLLFHVYFIRGEVLWILFHTVVLSLALQAAKYHDEMLEIC